MARFLFVLLFLSSCAYVPSSSRRAKKVMLKEWHKMQEHKERIQAIATVHGFTDSTDIKWKVDLATPQIDLHNDYRIGISRKKFDSLMTRYTQLIRQPIRNDISDDPKVIWKTLREMSIPDTTIKKQYSIPVYFQNDTIYLNSNLKISWSNGNMNVDILHHPIRKTIKKEAKSAVIQVDKNKGWIILLILVIVGLIVLILFKSNVKGFKNRG